MSYRTWVGYRITKKRHELFLASQAMLVWNLTHGSGCKARARAIADRQDARIASAAPRIAQVASKGPGR